MSNIVGNSAVLLFISISVVCICSTDGADPTIVTLSNGKIQGRGLITARGKKYYTFQEIPYASPPVDDLRFKVPVAPQNWAGTLDTTRNTKVCYQMPYQQSPAMKQSEDCLYLNVATPVTPGDSSVDPLPVLFYIHGGGFVNGDGTYQITGPQFFIDYDVVVVSINYRLGPFGFLTTADGVIPGNLGLKDQNFALKWVQANIHLFGGDPTKVTIMGESAGGGSVGYQLISKKSAGLFRGVISQSGTSICPFGMRANPIEFALRVGKAAGANTTDTTKLLTFLKALPASKLNEVASGISDPTGDNVWVPSIEDESEEGAFITGPMHDDIKNKNINQVPILIGFNSEEQLVFFAFNFSAILPSAQSYDADLTLIIPRNLKMDDSDRLTAGERLRQIYTNTTFQNNLSGFVKFLSDGRFTTPIIRHADLQSSYTDVYLFQISHKGALGAANVTYPGTEAVGHAEDLKYTWEYQGLKDNSDITKFSASDILTHHRILKMWTNFVKYLDPTPEDDGLLQNVRWPKFTSEKMSYLNINSTLEVKENPKEYRKWKEIIDAYAQSPIYIY